MASHAFEQRLVTETQDLFSAGGPEAVAPLDGASLISDWLKVLETAQTNNTSGIESRLKELRGILQMANPDPDRIRELIISLAEQTWLLTQGSNVQEPVAKQLDGIVGALRNFSTLF